MMMTSSGMFAFPSTKEYQVALEEFASEGLLIDLSSRRSIYLVE
jgi:hypothetical protein